MTASVVEEHPLRDGADVDVDDEWADRAVMTERRTRWVLWVGRCHLAVLVACAVVLTVWAAALGPGTSLALLAIGLCGLFWTLLRGVGDGRPGAWWGLTLLVVLQLLAAVVAALRAGEVDPLITAWLVLQVVLLGLLVL